jgi:hypothetical protein
MPQKLYHWIRMQKSSNGITFVVNISYLVDQINGQSSSQISKCAYKVWREYHIERTWPPRLSLDEHNIHNILFPYWGNSKVKTLNSTWIGASSTCLLQSYSITHTLRVLAYKFNQNIVYMTYASINTSSTQYPLHLIPYLITKDPPSKQYIYDHNR